MRVNRQSDRQQQTYSSQYFAPFPGVKHSLAAFWRGQRMFHRLCPTTDTIVINTCKYACTVNYCHIRQRVIDVTHRSLLVHKMKSYNNKINLYNCASKLKTNTNKQICIAPKGREVRGAGARQCASETESLTDKKRLYLCHPDTKMFAECNHVRLVWYWNFASINRTFRPCSYCPSGTEL